MTAIEPQPDAEPASMTPEDAKNSMDELIGERLNLEHDNPKYKRLTRQIERFAGVLAKDQADKAEAQHQEAVAEMEEHRSAPELERKKEAEEEVAILKGLGFEGEVPEVVAPHHLTALRMQRMAAEGDTAHLIPLMETELRGLGASSGTMDLLRTYANLPDADPGLQTEIFERLADWIYRANSARYASTTKQNTQETP